MGIVKSTSIFILLVASMVFTSCKEKDIGPVEFLTIETQQKQATATTHYVFATDTKGNFLDMQPLEFGKVVTMTALLDDDNVHVTFVNLTTAGIRFSTYSSVPKSTHVIESIDEQGANVAYEMIGRAEITLTNFSGSTSVPSDLMISNGYASNFFGDSPQLLNGTLTTGISIASTKPPLLLSTVRNGVPVYAFVNTIPEDLKISLDVIEDFKPCEVVVELSGDAFNNTLASGRLPNVPGQYLTGYAFPSPAGSRKLASINGFSEYRTFIQKRLPNNGGWWNYSNYKTQITSSFKFPEFTAAVTDKTPVGLTVATSGSVGRCRAWFLQNKSNDFYWSVEGGTIEDLRRLNIPKEIRSQFASVNFDDLYLWQLDVHPGDSKLYNDYISEILSGVRHTPVEALWLSPSF